MCQSASHIFVMLTFLLVITLVLQPIKGCILGFRYVPPADSAASATSVSTNNRQSCVPCRRSSDEQQDDSSAFSRAFRRGKLSPRTFFSGSPGSATTAATTTTAAPCCQGTGAGELKNITGRRQIVNSQSSH